MEPPLSEPFPPALEKILRPSKPGTLLEPLRRLQAGFTVDEGRRQGGYLRHPPAVAAYGAFYGLRTATKVHRLLKELQLAPESLLDLGAGTLGAALGAVAACPSLTHVHGIDRSRQALHWGSERLLTFSPELKVKTFAGDLLHRKTRFPKVDLVIAANVLDEFRHQRDRQRLFRSMLSALKPEGTLLLVEPGTRRASQKLIEIREAVKDDLAILGPCTGAPTCPYAEHPKDGWCFSEWEPKEPRWYGRLREGAGVRRQRLTWSWLALKARGKGTQRGGRVISGAMEVGRYLCTPNGRLLVDTATDSWQRGTLLSDWSTGSPE